MQLKAPRHAPDAAKQAADISTEEYLEGLVDFTTVISTLTALATQQNLLASQQGTVAANLVEVYRSLGAVGRFAKAETPAISYPRKPRMK